VLLLSEIKLNKTMSNFIKSVTFSSWGNTKSPKRKITFSIPDEVKSSAITVICGKNRTGKSYILNHIEKCISKHNKNIRFNNKYSEAFIQDSDITIEITNLTEEIEDFFIINNVNHLSKIATTISVSKNTKFKKRGHPSQRSGGINEIPFKTYLDQFAKDSISYICEYIGREFSSIQWDDDVDDYRGSLTNFFEKDILYKLNENDDLVSFFSNATGGHLYLNNNKSNEGFTFDIYLVYSENIITHYNNWSDGQKILFICLIVIKYLKPKIFLFDEIENHLHPEFISILLEYLKNNIPQSIITTHHPHIIFSNHVDSVWYIELQNPEAELPFKLNRIDKNLIKAPNRQAIILEKNYEKLINTYKLFDSYDNQLIRLSSSILSDLTEVVVEVFTKLFYYEIIPSKSKKKTDLQVEGLLKYLLDKIDSNKNIDVLEVGAGKGRILLDIAKMKKEPLVRNITWHLYEPVDKVREELIQNLSILDGRYNVHVLDIINPDKKYDLIFVANVLHELNPIDFSKLVCALQNSISVTGELIIIDIYPLLLPEKLSVPYKAEELLGLFRLLNWKGKAEKINIKHSTIEAYWISLSKDLNKDEISYEGVLSIIENYWENNILRTRCQDYTGKPRLRGAEEIVDIMCELTSIASITSYFKDEWLTQPERLRNIPPKESISAVMSLISSGLVEEALRKMKEEYDKKQQNTKDILLLQCRYYLNRNNQLLGLNFEENYEVKISNAILEIINQSR
jgi:energy-coupling factor transporter ATP-binding protein EcfA2/2-polyprenyl-3-methyl-5-hydroxy-6-metoxy-1,4-benzoquinol methylase